MTVFIILVIFFVISGGLAWFLIARDRGEKEPIGTLWLALGFGFLGAIAASFIESRVIPEAVTQELMLGAGAAGGVSTQTFLIAAILVGLVEEVCKFVPFAIYLYKKRFFNEHTDGVIYFALAGLGFGLPENILYTLQYGAKVGVARIFLTPFFHAATTALVGYYLSKGKLHGNSPWKVGWALLAAIAIHSLYDFGLFSQQPFFVLVSLCTTLGISVSLFVFYSKARARDQDMGLSAVGNNSFCRTCGHPNPNHNLYCTNCGNNA